MAQAAYLLRCIYCSIYCSDVTVQCRLYSCRAVLTAAHCICDAADREPKAATFCEPSDNNKQPVNQIKPVKAGDSIEEMLNRGEEVDTTMFNEITLKVGSKDITEALAFNAEQAFVFRAVDKGGGKTVRGKSPDIGIILSVTEMISTATCSCVGTISLPTRYHILFCLHFYYLFIG